jgi:hypothetical protein
MYIELNCGKCESGLTLDSDPTMDTMSLDLVHRFTRAHEACGYMVPNHVLADGVPNDEKRRIIKPRKIEEDE